MKELTTALGRHAAKVQPTADVADLYKRIERRHQRERRSRLAVTVAAGSLVLIGAVGLVVAQRSDVDGNITESSIAPAASRIDLPGGLVIDAGASDQPHDYSTLDRVHPDVTDGPYSLVVRRTDGGLGFASAVVTYPVGDVGVADGNISSDPQTGVDTVSKLRSGGRIVVRAASLDTDELLALADAIEVVDGKPTFISSPALDGFAVVASDSNQPPVIRSASYGCEHLGEPILGTLCYTGLASSPGFEDAVYAGGFQLGPKIDGAQSVVSKVGGGNATLAWELEPGIIAYVGYSGGELNDARIAALERLAEATSLLPPADWSLTNPQVNTQNTAW